MKKLKVKLSNRQAGGLQRNYNSMSRKNQIKFAPVIIAMAIIVRTIRGKLGLTIQTPDGEFLNKARAIFTALTNNTGSYYTPAFASLALIDSQADLFEDAIDDFMQGGLGTEAAKTEAKKVLLITLKAALAYINNIAYLDQEHAVEIIEGAAMHLVRIATSFKPDFQVRQGDVTGEVKLISRAARINNKLVKASYKWEYSVDNGVKWDSLGDTIVSRTTAEGMSVDVKTLFRKCIVTREGTGAWCSPIAITPV
jgi:hypothetical protein